MAKMHSAETVDSLNKRLADLREMYEVLEKEKGQLQEKIVQLSSQLATNFNFRENAGMRIKLHLACRPPGLYGTPPV